MTIDTRGEYMMSFYSVKLHPAHGATPNMGGATACPRLCCPNCVYCEPGRGQAVAPPIFGPTPEDTLDASNTLPLLKGKSIESIRRAQSACLRRKECICLKSQRAIREIIGRERI